MDNRGVTEVIGFVLVFSLVLATISLVYVGGLASLDDSRDAERFNNAERAFDVLADNFQTLARGDAPNRATEIKLSGAQIETSTNQGISVNATSMSSSASAQPVAIRYRSDGDARIVYEHGAIIRTENERSIMLREPDFVFSESSTVVRYTELRGSGLSVGGDTTVLVYGETRSQRLLAAESDPGTVTLEFETQPERADVWVSYFESKIDWEADSCHTEQSDTLVVCEFETNSLHIGSTRIRISFR